MRTPRRSFLLGALASLLGLPALGGCGAAGAERLEGARPAPLPPLKGGPLSGLMALSGLRWSIFVRPREIASVPWLIPPIASVVPEENFTRFAAATGIDLRQVQEAVIASYGGGGGEATLYLARHGGDPRRVERWYRARFTGDERRTVDRADVVRLSGKVGGEPHAVALIGRDVVAIQQGGSVSKGPARIATLYATEKLKRAPTVLAEEPLRSLAARFGAVPLLGLALGPFEGELARGARGLLAGATAIGAGARPSAREGIALAIAVAGDFSTSGAAAAEELLGAWNELAGGSFGHLLGLDQPMEAPLATHAEDAVAVAVELQPRKLAAGLRAATSSQIDEIMR